MASKYTRKVYFKLIVVAFSTLIIYMSLTIHNFYQMGNIQFKKMDTKILKMFFNNSYPIVNIVNNIGVNTTINKEFLDYIKFIVNFDFKDPLSILNSEFNIMKKYTSNVVVKNNENDSGEFASNTSSITLEDDLRKKDFVKEETISNGKITIHNETKYKIDIDEIMKSPIKLNFEKKGPKVLIYHTHSTESYLETINQLNNKDIADRNSNTQVNVIKVGEELAKNLKKRYKIGVIHNKTIHTYPSDKGAYQRSYITASKIIKNNPSIKIAIDVHRDAMGSEGKYRVVSKINNKNTAKVMFVVGTDAAGLEHILWKENLKFAIFLQEELNAKYPGLAKPIYLSKNRYNQHLTNATLIVEVGGNGNTIDEAVQSTKCLADVINEFIKSK